MLPNSPGQVVFIDAGTGNAADKILSLFNATNINTSLTAAAANAIAAKFTGTGAGNAGISILNLFDATNMTSLSAVAANALAARFTEPGGNEILKTFTANNVFTGLSEAAANSIALNMTEEGAGHILGDFTATNIGSKLSTAAANAIAAKFTDAAGQSILSTFNQTNIIAGLSTAAADAIAGRFTSVGVSSIIADMNETNIIANLDVGAANAIGQKMTSTGCDFISGDISTAGLTALVTRMTAGDGDLIAGKISTAGLTALLVRTTAGDADGISAKITTPALTTLLFRMTVGDADTISAKITTGGLSLLLGRMLFTDAAAIVPKFVGAGMAAIATQLSATAFPTYTYPVTVAKLFSLEGTTASLVTAEAANTAALVGVAAGTTVASMITAAITAGAVAGAATAKTYTDSAFTTFTTPLVGPLAIIIGLAITANNTTVYFEIGEVQTNVNNLSNDLRPKIDDLEDRLDDITRDDIAINLVYASPASGSANDPGFRSLVNADLPAARTATTLALTTTAGPALTTSQSSGSVAVRQTQTTNADVFTEYVSTPSTGVTKTVQMGIAGAAFSNDMLFRTTSATQGIRFEVNSSGVAAFTSTGAFNMNLLTASTLLGLDSSKNMVSLGSGSSGQVLTSNGAAAPTFQTLSSITTAGNLANGSTGEIPYQTSANNTSFIGGTGPLFLNGASIPVVGTTIGTGTVVVLATSPTLTTPVLGAATGTSLALTTTAGPALTTSQSSGTVMVRQTQTTDSDAFTEYVSTPPIGGPKAVQMGIAGDFFNNDMLFRTTSATQGIRFEVNSGGVARFTDTGAFNMNLLTASTLVGLDSSKNMVSLSSGSSGQVLTSNGASSPTFQALPTTVNTANFLAGGVASQIPYQVSAGNTAFVPNGTSGQVLTSNGTLAPSFQSLSSVGTANALSGGVANDLPYQTGVGVTAFRSSANGVLVGGGAPTYSMTPSLETLTLNKNQGPVLMTQTSNGFPAAEFKNTGSGDTKIEFWPPNGVKGRTGMYGSGGAYNFAMFMETDNASTPIQFRVNGALDVEIADTTTTIYNDLILNNQASSVTRYGFITSTGKVIAGGAIVPTMTRITTVGSGTYTPPDFCTRIQVTCVGGGGGGGGVNTSYAGVGGGGGGAGVGGGLLPAGTISSSGVYTPNVYTYTIGGGGAGGVGVGGSNGGNTDFFCSTGTPSFTSAANAFSASPPQLCRGYAGIGGNAPSISGGLADAGGQAFAAVWSAGLI